MQRFRSEKARIARKREEAQRERREAERQAKERERERQRKAEASRAVALWQERRPFYAGSGAQTRGTSPGVVERTRSRVPSETSPQGTRARATLSRGKGRSSPAARPLASRPCPCPTSGTHGLCPLDTGGSCLCLTDSEGRANCRPAHARQWFRRRSADRVPSAQSWPVQHTAAAEPFWPLRFRVAWQVAPVEEQCGLHVRDTSRLCFGSSIGLEL